MKILHVYNTAGVGSILAKFMDRLFGTKSDVIVPKIADPYGFTTYGKVYDEGLLKFKIRSVLKTINYDIIHCHSVEGIAKWIKTVFPKKKVIMHFHGSDIRNKWNQKKKYWIRADKIFVSTEDLLNGSPKETVWIPNPVDTDIFFSVVSKRSRNALHFKHDADDEAFILAITHNLNLIKMHDRVREPVAYQEMPKIFNEFGYYIDVKKKFGKLLRSLSKTGLEALACGCKVVQWDSKIIHELPFCHKPFYCAKNVFDEYKKILEI